jgi:hypothetical protein
LTSEGTISFMDGELFFGNSGRIRPPASRGVLMAISTVRI